jgi:small neutral amino acid transporter SnatA (MarC family)
MLILLLTLAAIALFDSLSMVPLAVIPLTVALGSPRPWAAAWAFVGGIFVAYFLSGVALLVGTDFFLETFGAYLHRLWNEPNALELATQIFLGVLLILSAFFLRRQGHVKEASSPPPEASPKAMLVLGSTLVLLGLPGAVPYVAGVERIVRSEMGWMADLAALGFYNLLFVLPFLTLLAVRYFLPQQAGRFFQVLSDFALRLMPRLVVVIFFLVGVVMVVDGIGWFLGHPVLPVAPRTE